MKKMFFLLVIILILVLPQFYVAQQTDYYATNDSPNMELPRHSIDLRISFWNNSQSNVSVGVTGVSVDAGTGGISGRIMYNYYFNDEYAFNFSAGAMATEVKVRTLSNYTSTVVPIMMGMKYFFIGSSEEGLFRPYLSGSMGVLFGTESNVEVLSVQSHTESAMGLYAGFGSDFILGSLIKLHADVGYNLYTDFTEEIGSRKNYSGPEFSFGIGFMF